MSLRGSGKNIRAFGSMSVGIVVIAATSTTPTSIRLKRMDESGMPGVLLGAMPPWARLAAIVRPIAKARTQRNETDDRASIHNSE